MGKRIGPAIIVEAIVLAVAFVFSTTYFCFGLYRTSHIHTVVLVVLWVLVAAILLFVLWTRSLKREEMVRRFYLNKDYVYNHEIGYAPISTIVPDGDPYELVTFVADSLARMSYGFDVAEAPEDFTPDYLVKSSVFTFHEPYVEEAEDDDETGQNDQDVESEDNPVVIDQWEGSVLRTSNTEKEDDYEVVGSFKNARELARLLQGLKALRATEEDDAEGAAAIEETEAAI